MCGRVCTKLSCTIHYIGHCPIYRFFSDASPQDWVTSLSRLLNSARLNCSVKPKFTHSICCSYTAYGSTMFPAACIYYLSLSSAHISSTQHLLFSHFSSLDTCTPAAACSNMHASPLLKFNTKCQHFGQLLCRCWAGVCFGREGFKRKINHQRNFPLSGGGRVPPFGENFSQGKKKCSKWPRK